MRGGVTTDEEEWEYQLFIREYQLFFGEVGYKTFHQGMWGLVGGMGYCSPASEASGESEKFEVTGLYTERQVKVAEFPKLALTHGILLSLLI